MGDEVTVSWVCEKLFFQTDAVGDCTCNSVAGVPGCSKLSHNQSRKDSGWSCTPSFALSQVGPSGFV